MSHRKYETGQIESGVCRHFRQQQDAVDLAAVSAAVCSDGAMLAAAVETK